MIIFSHIICLSHIILMFSIYIYSVQQHWQIHLLKRRPALGAMHMEACLFNTYQCWSGYNIRTLSPFLISFVSEIYDIVILSKLKN